MAPTTLSRCCGRSMAVSLLNSPRGTLFRFNTIGIATKQGLAKCTKKRTKCCKSLLNTLLVPLSLNTLLVATDPERMGTCMSHREAQASNQARRHHMRQVAWRNRNEARGSSLSTGSGVPAESSYWNQFKDPTSHVAVSISRDASMEPTAPPAAPVTISGIEWAAHISRRHQEVYGADR